MTHDEAADLLHQRIQELLPHLVDGGDQPTVTEFVLVVGHADLEDGASSTSVITNRNALWTHILGSLEFAKLRTEAAILSGSDN